MEVPFRASSLPDGERGGDCAEEGPSAPPFFSFSLRMIVHHHGIPEYSHDTIPFHAELVSFQVAGAGG